MPGWHDATRRLQEDGRLRLVGIIQEQHPERCRLFMQWKRMSWPILVDSLGQTGTKVVPVSYLLDEHGVVRAVRPDVAVIASFVDAPFAAPDAETRPPPAADELEALQRRAEQANTGEAWRALGDARFLGPRGDLDAAIDAYRRATTLEPQDGRAWFRLGVATRRRFEQAPRPGDFQAASDAWTRALALQPDQYIWRRRLQQYGPLMDKPYPFYDWVEVARAELRARGETPVELMFEPRGSELAGKAAPPGDAPAAPHPDPEGQLPRDTGERVRVELALVPARIPPGTAGRLHVSLQPADGVHWNDEAGVPEAWLELPPGWRVAATPVLVRTGGAGRVLELDVHAPADAFAATTGTVSVFYDVCLDPDGTCVRLRQDVSVTLRSP